MVYYLHLSTHKYLKFIINRQDKFTISWECTQHKNSETPNRMFIIF